MQRRNFITGTIAAAVVAFPVARLPVNGLAAAESSNTFTQADTLIQRINKFNELTGMRFTIGWRWINAEWRELSNGSRWSIPPDTMDARNLEFVQITGDYCGYEDDHKRFMWRVFLVENGKRWSGDMMPGEMFDWTAQVGFGYRIAKAQGS